MNNEALQFVSRFDAQPTRWSMIQKAHGHSMAGGEEARNYLVMRYSAAIRSYVKVMTRNDDQADELTQDVIVRLLQGDFAGADPQRGRFRDLLKTAVRNMVRNRWAKQKTRRTVDLDVAEVDPEESSEVDHAWTESWQHQLLELAWARLQAYQDSHAGSVAHTALKTRTDFPDDTSEELAARLAERLNKPVKPDQARQLVRRARVRFAEFLLEEIADGLTEPTPDNIQEELGQAGLLELVRSYLPAENTGSED